MFSSTRFAGILSVPSILSWTNYWVVFSSSLSFCLHTFGRLEDKNIFHLHVKLYVVSTGNTEHFSPFTILFATVSKTILDKVLRFRSKEKRADY